MKRLNVNDRGRPRVFTRREHVHTQVITHVGGPLRNHIHYIGYRIPPRVRYHIRDLRVRASNVLHILIRIRLSITQPEKET